MNAIGRRVIDWSRPRRSTIALCLALGGIEGLRGNARLAAFLLALGAVNYLVFFRPGRQHAPRGGRPQGGASGAAARADAASVSSARCELQITRRYGGTGRLRAFHVIVDGTDLGKLKRGQTQVFAIAAGVREVCVKVDWSHSRSITLEARPGQRFSLECWGRPHAAARKGDFVGLARPGEADE